MDNLEKLTHEVATLAREVGAYIAEQRKTFSWSKAEIKGHNDLVSYVDKTAERMITKRLAELLPEAGYITEEETVAQSEATYRWIVDPLDGTTNFIHGIPAYAVSIALAKEHEVILGVVYEVTRDECFTAWVDGGAYLNGERIAVSTIDQLHDSLILTGLPIQAFDKKQEYLAIVGELMTMTHGLRRIGSAAVDLAYVACGRGEVYFERNINAWDVAAGVVLVKEAGGTVSDFSGGDNYLFGREIVAGGAVHTQLVKVIQKFWN